MANLRYSSEQKASGPMLQINDLHVHYETADGAVKAVSGVDLTLQEGERI